MLAIMLVSAMAGASPSSVCVAAAHRYFAFLSQEAKGTRHEKQIAASVTRNGSVDAAVVEIAKGLTDDQCTYIIAAPDSAIRAMAKATLPERQGK